MVKIPEHFNEDETRNQGVVTLRPLWVGRNLNNSPNLLNAAPSEILPRTSYTIRTSLTSGRGGGGNGNEVKLSTPLTPGLVYPSLTGSTPTLGPDRVRF